MAGAPLPATLEHLRARLEAGDRRFPSLRLGEIDGLDLDLSACDLHGSCFKEARFGHARLSDANVEGCCFQQSLLWGADLSGLR
ncbi:MAG: pentapeptide repeat-containing protein, partial [Vulcanococcus sp.]